MWSLRDSLHFTDKLARLAQSRRAALFSLAGRRHKVDTVETYLPGVRHAAQASCP